MISTFTKTQQEAQMFSLMSLMLPTLLLGGFMFPIESMPLPLRIVSNIVPSKWYFLIVKDVMIKGLGFSQVWKESLVLLGMSLLLLTISFKKFKIRL
jgi:ABC-2 type transport system permease protein